MRSLLTLTMILGLVASPCGARPFFTEDKGREIVYPAVAGGVAGTLFGGFAAPFVGTLLAVPFLAGAFTLGGVALGSLSCGVTQRLLYGRSFKDRYLNCLAQPLRYFDANPRDRMYLAHLRCDSSTISARLASASGRFESRHFSREGEVLRSILLVEEDDRGRPLGISIELPVKDVGQGLRYLTSGRLDNAGRVQTTVRGSSYQPLLQDYDLYRELCDRGNADARRVSPRGFDAVTPLETYRRSR